MATDVCTATCVGTGEAALVDMCVIMCTDMHADVCVGVLVDMDSKNVCKQAFASAFVGIKVNPHATKVECGRVYRHVR